MSCVSVLQDTGQLTHTDPLQSHQHAYSTFNSNTVEEKTMRTKTIQLGTKTIQLRTTSKQFIKDKMTQLTVGDRNHTVGDRNHTVEDKTTQLRTTQQHS